MSATQKCPQCGAEPGGGAFEGLCPKCVVQLMRGIPMVVPVTEKPGDRIGRYKLLQKIGEGGCGVVYMAEQEEPVRRKVALKVIKLGMDTKQFVARFEAERQALALMDHPNIARVFDAGATDTGRPYFVMELVRGIKITDYCDQNHLSTAERLDLFIQVCQAVQHAHQKGIIHRDLKPSNILVAQHDTVAVPKVIDFGIAKATSDQRLTDKTLFTAFEQFIGTPAYMSPEQAQLSGLDLDTRTDIYSLGVLLYELLTGNPPFDPEALMKSGLDEMRRTIRETEPVRPSAKLSQTLVAADMRRLKSPSSDTPGSEEEVRASSRRLLRTKETIALVRGDLDWIVMKCLEKDRARRYETANGLATDLQRHLGNEPVIARPPSAAYRFQKLVRRNKLAFAAATAVAAALVLGALVSTWQAVRATRAQRTADTARNEQAHLRLRAERGELDARQKTYASDMNLAQQALAVNNLGRAQERLNRHRPAAIPLRSSRREEALTNSEFQVPSSKFGVSLLTSAATDLRGWEWRYLWQHCQSDALFTLCQKSNSIFSLALSPDGKWLVVGEQEEGRLSIWDLQKREEIMRFPADEGPAFARFSPREHLLAFSSGVILPSGNQQCRVRLWDGDSKRIVAELPLDGPCRGLAFSGDGATLATLTAGEEGQLALWKVPEGTRLARHPALQVRHGLGSPFAVAPDLSVAAYAVARDRIRVVDLRTGEGQWMEPLSDEYVTALAFSPDGKILASAGGFAVSPIRLWDVASRKVTGALEGHRGWVCSLAFRPDGKTLAAGSSDQTIRLWNINGGPPLRTLLGHKNEVWSLAFLPDSTTLVSGGKDGSVFVWDTAASERARSHVTLPESFVAWSFATNGHTIFTCDRQGRVAQRQGSHLAEERLFEIGTSVSAATFIPHRSMLVAAGVGLGDPVRTAVHWSSPSRIQVWDLQTRSLLRELSLPNSPPQIWLCLAQGNRLIIGDAANQSLHEFDLTTWQKVQTWPAPAQQRTGALSPDGRWCVTLGYGGASMINDLTTGQTMVGNLQIRQAHGVTFSADGKLLAAGTPLGFTRIWDAATLQPTATLRGSQGAVHSVAFSADGQRLVTGRDGKEALTLWDVKSREELLTLEGQGTMFFPPAFSPDGTVLGSMNANGVLHLWRAPSWAEIEAREKESGK